MASKTIQEVNKEIVLYAESEMDLNGMGTTLVAAIMAQSQVVIANVGDSRGYLLQNDVMRQLTEDHSLVHELLRTGEISKEDAMNHPRKNILYEH